MCIGIAIVGIVPVDGGPIQFYGKNGNSSHDKLLSENVPVELHNRSFKIEYIFPSTVRLDAPDSACQDQAVTFGVAVSIPIGFSSSLQHANTKARLDAIYRFQSLSGFQVRCNALTKRIVHRKMTQFQSLSGFQVRCNFAYSITQSLQYASFNPYRVFKFAATRWNWN